MTQRVRTRIAPAPTGWLHIGTARTALFNYLFAKKQGGIFIVRIEDTDPERSRREYEEEILESLQWLGIEPDESPKHSGLHGPYRQSERTAVYQPHIEKLVEDGKAYYCPHSEAELEAERKSLLEAGRPPVHVCPHRDRGGERGIIRFKTPAGRTLSFRDIIRGDIRFESDLIGDFSIAKDLKTPLYNFAVTIDDHEMQISQVIRGEDLLPNTPKQLLIWEALWPDQTPPEYAHLPLILGLDRSKLSKRHGATAIREFREQGYLPEALVNFMALLGWNPGGDRELFSMPELKSAFSLEHVQKSGAVFNIEKLDWMNRAYIRRMDPEELLRRAAPFLPQPYTLYPKPYTLAVLALEQPRLKKLAELPERVDYFFGEPEYDKELLRWKDMTDDEIADSLKKSINILNRTSYEVEPRKSRKIEDTFLVEAEKIGDRGKLLWPLRVALSGKKASPGPFEIAAILRKEKTLERIEAALNKLSN